MTVLLAVVVLVVVVAIPLAVAYNRMLSERHHVEEAWRQLEVELHHRHELVAGLVAALLEHAAAGDSVVADAVSRARGVAAGGGTTPSEQAGHEAGLARALTRLLDVAEARPKLAGDAEFVDLRRELADVEERIAAAAGSYDVAVGELNGRIAGFPWSALATLFGFVPAERFDVPEAELRSIPAEV